MARRRGLCKIWTLAPESLALSWHPPQRTPNCCLDLWFGGLNPWIMFSMPSPATTCWPREQRGSAETSANRFPLARSTGRGRQGTSGQQPRATGARAAESSRARSCSPSASRLPGSESDACAGEACCMLTSESGALRAGGVSLFVSVSLSVSFSVSLCLLVSLSLVSVSLSVWLSVSVCLCLSVCVFVSVSV